MCLNSYFFGASTVNQSLQKDRAFSLHHLISTEPTSTSPLTATRLTAHVRTSYPEQLAQYPTDIGCIYCLGHLLLPVTSC